MSDLATNWVTQGRRGVITPFINTPLGDYGNLTNTSTAQTATTWTANRCVYQPICVPRPVTVTNALISVVTQNGNVDVGIYTWAGALIVSNGGVAVGAAGAQQVDFADTALAPGWYRLAFACSSSTAVFRCHNPQAGAMRSLGLQQQASAYPLPSPTATFAAYATALAPQVALAYSTTT